MNPTEQAHFFLRNARYADFFKLMQLNEIENNVLALLRMEFVQEKQGVFFHQRLETFLNNPEVELTKVLPTEEMTATAQILSKFSFHTGVFIGREQALQDLHASLQKNLPTVLVNGLGGIGKTTLAKEYIRRHLDKYTHVVWVEQTTTAVEAFISDATLLESLGRTFDKETEQERFDLVLSDLKKRGGTNLLVLDNYQRPDNEEDFDVISYLSFSPNWRVLLTSRESIMDFETLKLDILSEAEATELFKLHVGEKPVDDNELRSLLETIEYHTLMIELLAKNYRQNKQLKSIADFAGKIKEREIDDQVLQRLVRVAHSEREIRMYKYLLKVFDLGKLDHKALHLLKQIAVLPAEPLPINLILLTKQEEQGIYSEALEGLEQKGWVSFKGEEEVQMHRLVQMLILKITLPTYQDCKMLCEIIIDALDYNRIRANPMQYQWTSKYAEALLINIGFQEILERKYILQSDLGHFYIASGNYNKGLNLLEENLLLAETVYGKMHLNYTASLHNLANLYNNIGLYEKALPLYEVSLQIKIQTVGKQSIEYVASLNGLGILYCNIQIYDKPIALFEEALQTIFQTIGKQNKEYSITLGNLATVYDMLQQYEKSFHLRKEALQIMEKIVGKKDSDYGITLNNMACWYLDQQLYDKALPLYEEVLQIWTNTLGEQHPDYAMVMYNIGRCFIELQEIEKGIQYIQKVYQILLEGVGEANPYTQQVGMDLVYFLEMKEKGEL